MSKRRKRGDNPGDLLDALGEHNAGVPNLDLTASDIANEAYGSRVPFAGMVKSIRAKPLPIQQIYPDVAQPRRTIPSAVRHYWDGQPTGVSYLFEMWIKEVDIERGKPFDLRAYLIGESTERVPTDDGNLEAIPRQAGSLETSLLAIVDLASSIRRDGLTNPITVVQQDDYYVVETGERRWLAYHLLHMIFSRETSDWSAIPARLVEKTDIWRQASENNARDDLNAVARARQFALLLMDLHGFEQFQPLHVYEQERHFYAQVADGAVWRIPRHAGEKLLNAMGLKHGVQLRQYRSLLSLPDIVWILADDLNWTESFIRKELRGRAEDDNDLIRRAILAARNEGYTVSMVTLYEHLLTDIPNKRSATETPSLEHLMVSDVDKLLKKMRRLPASERRRMADYLRRIADELED